VKTSPLLEYCAEDCARRLNGYGSVRRSLLIRRKNWCCVQQERLLQLLRDHGQMSPAESGTL